MLVVCNHVGGIVLPHALAHAEVSVKYGKNDVPDRYFEVLTAKQQTQILKLRDRKLLEFPAHSEEPMPLPPPVAEPGSSEIPLEVLLPEIAKLGDVKILDALSRQDPRPEVQEAVLKRCLELDKMPEREVEALQTTAEQTLPETPKARRGRPKGSKNKSSEPPPPDTQPAGA